VRGAGGDLREERQRAEVAVAKGYSVLQTGVCLLPLAVTILFASRAPILVRRFGARAVTVAGLLLVTLAMLGLTALGAATTIWYFELIMLFSEPGWRTSSRRSPPR
jgi:hypothetical protein